MVDVDAFRYTIHFAQKLLIKKVFFSIYAVTKPSMFKPDLRLTELISLQKTYYEQTTKEKAYCRRK